MAETFNCSVRARREEQLSIEDAPDEAPDFSATDSDRPPSASDDSQVFAVSGSSCFEVSDAGESIQGGKKRKYAERRSDTMRFLGKSVCVRACCRLLGVGQKTLQRLRRGEPVYTMKSRPRLPTHPAFGFAMRGDTAEKWPQIIMYLWHVYHSAAEYMPDGVRHRLGKPQLPEAPFNCQDRDSDDIDRHVNGFLKRLQTYSSDIDVHLIGPGTFKGERRHLQHGNQTELFYEYLAFCEARSQSPSSYTTFIRVCNKVIGPQIIMYLWHVYHSAAEYMPDGVRHRLGKPQLPEAPFNCQDRDSDDIDRHVNGFLKRLQTYSSDIDVHLIGPGTFKGERRHLQHGNQTELFYEYLAFCEARSQSPSSYTTFIRVCNKVIGPHVRSGHLHFRKQSEHSKCDVCVRLKQSLKFRHGRCEAASREANIRAYSMHILSQWLDRQVYWSMRSLSQTWFQSHREFGQRSFGAH